MPNISGMALRGAAHDVVLDDGVMDAGLAQLLAQLGVVRHGDAAVVHQDTGHGFFDAGLQGVHLLLLRLDDILVSQNRSPPGSSVLKKKEKQKSSFQRTVERA